MNNRLLTISETAVYLNISERTLLRWCYNGYLKPLRLPNGRKRYRINDIKNLLISEDVYASGKKILRENGSNCHDRHSGDYLRSAKTRRDFTGPVNRVPVTQIIRRLIDDTKNRE